MRRSKSNPAKYARNYNSISQRRMSSYNEADEDVELEHVKELMKTKSIHISNANEDQEDSDSRKRRRTDESQHDIIRHETAETSYTTDNTVLILTTSRKKQSKSKSIHVELTPEETKAAKLEYKKLSKKLQQLEQRRTAKDRRAELYKTLENHALSKEEAALMTSSANLGRQKLTKKEMLIKLLRMERAGIALTDEQREMLYTSTLVEDLPIMTSTLDSSTAGINTLATSQKMLDCMPQLKNDGSASLDRFKTDHSSNQTMMTEDHGVIPLSFPSSGKRKDKKKRKKESDHAGSNEMGVEAMDQGSQLKGESMSEMITTNKDTPKTVNHDLSVKSATQQMLASLISLKSQTDHKKETLAQKVENDELCRENKFFTGDVNSLPRPLNTEKTNSSTIIPVESKICKDSIKRKNEEEKSIGQVTISKVPIGQMKAHASKHHDEKAQLTSQPAVTSHLKNTFHWHALPINRPAELLEMRNQLPVIQMEYEIIDSVRNHAVTVICSETGSGKSTQVPQFLYESGITLGSALNPSDDIGLLIGVTQPRRVAAISTAKRVSYEMGFSTDKGMTIRATSGDREGSAVAYQTRYESAGLGNRTRIKFMTDGILLQEMKSDLLLRKYAAIVLDEAHERNLNTDILLGLLSAAVALRDKTSEEGSLPPLKIVIMSATLRVEDFVGNPRLFPTHPPNMVKVNGRTFPVSIHHSKVTELDKYEDLAFRKVCQIHRELPQGGILVFLTGQQEIVRMVKRLKKALVADRKKSFKEMLTHDTDDCVHGKYNSEGPRELDDDEVDGDLFQDDLDGYFLQDDIEEIIDNDALIELADPTTGGPPVHNDGPSDVLILPLYSILSATEQAKVFNPAPENTRLIVIATNVAETSITIPDIKYVIDAGRQKCRNYHPVTGMASYDIMWISQASADQRAGRAGRTGPGHCYRLYSASVYTRQFDPFTLPEVLVRPLEDVILMMKAMKISSINDFPFPTPPDSSQLQAATKLLANIGCIDRSRIQIESGDGTITKLGEAVSKLPIGVRYGKMLIAASEAEVLDFGITIVAILSESCPFVRHGEQTLDSDSDDSSSRDSESDTNTQNRHSAVIVGKNRWGYKGGDLLSALHAAGAYSYALRGGKGSESLANRFCEENGLHPVVMQRIQRMRLHLSQLVRTRFVKTESVAAKTGGILSTKPPTKHEEKLLQQAIASALLDHIARRTISTSLNTDTSYKSRSGYISCRSAIGDQMFIDSNSVLHSRDFRQLPEWVCYDHIIRKTMRDGRVITIMKNITPVEPHWLGSVAIDSNLLKLGKPLDMPCPRYDVEHDAINCFVTTKYGDHDWIINPIQIEMSNALQRNPNTSVIQTDDSYRWFARSLLEGLVIETLKPLQKMLNDEMAIITRRKACSKVMLLVSALSSAKVDTLSSLRKYWKEVSAKFLFNEVMSWIKHDHGKDAKQLWITTVKEQIELS